ncbi:hypothetical protein Fmac_032214 [Flemingia macrophylla]|uniref:Plastid division protein PDV1 n=1 Tax=Flemingia macrophylla TaxID=520843 RepID=A0ABD1L4R4_9FABA
MRSCEGDKRRRLEKTFLPCGGGTSNGNKSCGCDVEKCGSKMKWDMQMEEIEAILEKIWDIHDKLSDAIHSVSRSHFLTSVKTLKNTNRSGFVFVKDFAPPAATAASASASADDDDDDSAVREAKSLNAIRTALENLEDQLEFFHIRKIDFLILILYLDSTAMMHSYSPKHTIQTQQRIERDAAIARLEQSRMVLAMRLAEHRGKKYKVIEEALAFVGDVHDASCLVAPDIIYGQPNCSSAKNFVTDKEKRSNILINIFVSSFNFVKKTLGLDHMGGIVGNAALVAVSMIALLHLHQVTNHEQPYGQEYRVQSDRTVRRTELVGSPSDAHSSNLDVLLARGLLGDTQKQKYEDLRSRMDNIILMWQKYVLKFLEP